MKIRPVGAVLIYADGRTEMTKLIVAFRNSANGPKSVCQNYRPTGVQKTTPARPRTGKEMITVWCY